MWVATRGVFLLVRKGWKKEGERIEKGGGKEGDLVWVGVKKSH